MENFQEMKIYCDYPKINVLFDYFTNCGWLRLDIRSDYEISSEIIKILELIIEPTYTLFHCDKIATKAIASATERIIALNAYITCTWYRLKIHFNHYN